MTLSTALLVLQTAGAVQTPVQLPATADSALVHGTGDIPPAVTAVRAEPAPTLDGHLDDPVWQIATPVTGFRRDRPGDGKHAAEKTEVRVAYNSTRTTITVRHLSLG